MNRSKNRIAVAVLALLAVGFVLPSSAEARRYRGVVRRAPVVVAPVVVRRAPVVYAPVVRRPVVVASPYVGVGYGYGGSVRVGGVYVGW